MTHRVGHTRRRDPPRSYAGAVGTPPVGWFARAWGRVRPLRNVLVWVGIVMVAGLVGAGGYMLLERWSFFDSLYMSIITLATVGFKEVHPLGVGGQVWTMVLSVAAVGIIFGTVGVVADSVLAQVATGTREARRMQKKVDALRGHYIVCGFGRVGSLVSRELREDGFTVVVLDVNESSRGRAAADGFLVVPGDGTSDDVLRAAGVERARGLVSAIDSDADNVYVTLTARALNPGLFIVGRAGSIEVISKLRHAGADRAVRPTSWRGDASSS